MEIYQRFAEEIPLQNRNKARPQEVSLWRQEYRADVYWGQVSEAVWMLRSHSIIEAMWGFPGGSDGKESACNSRDPGSIPGSGRSPGGGHGNPLQYSCLENPMDRGVWWATVHRVTHSQTRLKRLSTHSRLHSLHKQNNEVWTLQLSKQLI